MKFSQNAINILAAKAYKGIGTAWLINNLKGNDSAEEIVEIIAKNSSHSSTISLEQFIKVQDNVYASLEQVTENVDGVVALGDTNFPIARGNVKKSEQPTILFYKGDISLLQKNNFNIATIGLLKPTQNIESREREVVSELVQCGATIVSGLALGCDTIAHQECLQAQGTTIGILPSPLSNIMPSSNTSLAQQILANGGLLISEYYRDYSSRNEMIARYIERDRLQALFSNGIVLAASYAKNSNGNDSGSRHAMEYAKQYSIPRAVIYNHTLDCDNEQYALNKQILNDDSTVTVLDAHHKESIANFIKKSKSNMTISQVALSLFDK